jgi:hypothetical protein
MPVTADFKVISDAKASLTLLGQNSAKVFEFTLPGLANAHPAVLSFVCIAHGNTGNMGNLAFEMILNGKSILSYGFPGFEVMTLHEVVSGTSLMANSNELFIKMLAGDGVLEIGDLVLWYKRIT